MSDMPKIPEHAKMRAFHGGYPDEPPHALEPSGGLRSRLCAAARAIAQDWPAPERDIWLAAVEAFAAAPHAESTPRSDDSAAVHRENETNFALLRDIAHLLDSRRQEGGKWEAWDESIRERIASVLISNAATQDPR